MDDNSDLTRRFEEHRSHLRAVAYRMLGSTGEADDAVQETWLRFSRADTTEVANLGGWLTMVVSRVCLNVLRSRTARREDPLDVYVPDPVVTAAPGSDPAHEAELADSVGLALLVVLETLPPAERLAFVLHDLFAVPFDDIAPMVGRTPTAARQLASRARRRVRGAAPVPDRDLDRQREVVDAFFAAARGGDLGALVAVLDPAVVLRTDGGAGASLVLHGADAVARRAASLGGTGDVQPAIVNGAAGAIVTIDGHVVSVMGFTVTNGVIAAIDTVRDPDRLARLALP